MSLIPGTPPTLKSTLRFVFIEASTPLGSGTSPGVEGNPELKLQSTANVAEQWRCERLDFDCVRLIRLVVEGTLSANGRCVAEGWAGNSYRCASMGSGEFELPDWGCNGNELVKHSYGRSELDAGDLEDLGCGERGC